MSQFHSNQSITRFDEHAIRRNAAALRSKFLREMMTKAWNRLTHKPDSVSAQPKNAAHA